MRWLERVNVNKSRTLTLANYLDKCHPTYKNTILSSIGAARVETDQLVWGIEREVAVEPYPLGSQAKANSGENPCPK
jgi:hypothetical protein